MNRQHNLTNISNFGVNINNASNHYIYTRYLNEIKSLKPLTKKEEISLFKKIKKSGDKQAIDKICKHNLLFVVSIAKRYSTIMSKTTLTLEDLISDGNIGLYMAIDKYDHTRGYKFISFAVWWIRQSILSSIQHNIKTIRVPFNIRVSLDKINKKEDVLRQVLEREPSSNEVFDAMVIDGDMWEAKYATKLNRKRNNVLRVDELKKINTFETSLNSFIGSDSPQELIETIKSDDTNIEDDMFIYQRKEIISNILNKLSGYERRIICMYFGLEGNEQFSSAKIGELEGVSDSCIVNHIKRILKKLKRDDKTNNLKELTYA